jgi:hypothetical protein
MDLNSLIVENEAIEAAPVEAAPAAEAPPVEADPVEAAPAEPAADPFAALGIDPTDLAQLAEIAPQLRAALEQTAYQPEPVYEQPETPQLDPFGEDFGSQLAQLIRQEINGAVAPLQERAQAEVLGEAESRAMDILKDDLARNGEFVGGEQVIGAARAYAEQLLPQFQERYGYGPRAAEAALTASAAHFRQLEQTIGQAAVERYKNELATLTSARTEPAMGRVGSEAPGEYKTEMDALAAWQSRNTAA